jgi:hypothetical protein
MPRYISQHTIACLTRQALQALIAELKRDEAVKTIRCVSDSLEGKLLCEFEAPDKETVWRFWPPTTCARNGSCGSSTNGDRF